MGFAPRPLGGIFCFIEARTSLDLRWKRMEVEELEGSGFVSGGGAVEEGAKVFDREGEGEQFGVGSREVLVGEGKINFVFSFKDKTCKFLLNEEGFIPDEVGGSVCCSNLHAN